jgi:hypothetical protein
LKLPKPLLERVQIVQDAPDISSDGGLVLLMKTERRSGLVRRLADRLCDRRRQKSVTHSLWKMLAQRTMGICLGWEDCNDFDALGNDPLYTVCLNGKPASQPTLSTFENAVGRRELYMMSRELVQFFIDRHADKPPKRIVLDLDATDDPAHGQQEFEFYHGYYQTHCFLPLLAFASADDGPMELIGAVLRPGNSHAGRRSAAVLRRLVKMFKEVFPNTEIRLRADAGFALPEMYATCEALGLGYAISLPKNIVLLYLSSELENQSRAQFLETGLKARLFGEFNYSAGTWPKERRVVVKAEVTVKGNNPRYVVTNLDGSPEEIYNFYTFRGDSENRIKELKLDLSSGRTSCHRFTANCFRLLMHAAAFILMTLLREMLAGTDLARCTMGQIRLKLLKIAAIVERRTRRILVRLPRGHPHAGLLRTLAA